MIVADGTGAQITKIDLNSKVLSGSVAIPGAAVFLYQVLEVPTVDGCLVGKANTDVAILARSNFATIKNPTWFSGCVSYLVDSLDDSKLVAFTMSSPSNTLRHFDRTSWDTDIDFIHADLNIATFGFYNNILNFGPYQYVVTIVSNGGALSTVVE